MNYQTSRQRFFQSIDDCIENLKKAIIKLDKLGKKKGNNSNFINETVEKIEDLIEERIKNIVGPGWIMPYFDDLSQLSKKANEISEPEVSISLKRN